MPGSNNNDRPQTNRSDFVHTGAKAVLSAIPIIGGPASELFSLVVTPSLSKRRDEWIESIAKGLKELEEHVESFTIENLRENDSFVSAVMYASAVAIRNHQKEKLEALKNAVLNTAMPNAPEEDYQLMFLNFVDSLTEGHLRMLKILDDYRAQQPRNRSGGVQIEFIDKSNENAVSARKVLPDMGVRQAFHDQVLRDLQRRGLLKIDMGYDSHLIQKIVYAQPTDLGKQLLAFINSPLAKRQNED